MSKKSEQFGKILKNLLEVNNMKQCELSQKLNTTDTTISKYINGIQLPRFEMMNDIAELFNVSIDYLLGSEDNNVLLAPDESEIMTIPVLKHLRYTDSLHTPTEDNIDQYYQLPRRKYSVYNEVFAVKVHKDHMYPRIMEGDIVICETISIADNLIDGDICIVTTGDEEAVCREVAHAKDGLIFNSFNTFMPPEFVSFEDMRRNNIHIIGRVIKLVVQFYNVETK